MFKVKDKDTRTTLGRRRSGVFIVNFKHFTPYSSVFIVNFEQVNAGSESSYILKQTCSFQLRVCLSIYDLSMDTRH